MTGTDTQNYKGHVLNVNRKGEDGSPPDHLLPPLYDPKIGGLVNFDGKVRIRFIGFQLTPDGCAVVQEWVCDIG
ncbi:hypothetical protein [Silvimonas soli]|uniref:hypothetical protein n=1 Tax=Silvimonas soli TaxID=2980100 RepID=UPI0024B37BA2|nr:hypothetical protein [Silvimonas soli]